MVLSFNIYAQQSLEISAMLGYTVHDLDKLIEKDEISNTYATDWNEFSYGISVQYIYASLEKIALGGELDYQYLYWYSVKIPYGTSPIYRTYEVGTVRLVPFLRLGSGNFFSFDIGPEINLLNGLNPGLMASGNINIPVTEKLEIPVKARMDLFNNIVLTVPVTLNVGVRLKL